MELVGSNEKVVQGLRQTFSSTIGPWPIPTPTTEGAGLLFPAVRTSLPLSPDSPTERTCFGRSTTGTSTLWLKMAVWKRGPDLMTRSALDLDRLLVVEARVQGVVTRVPVDLLRPEATRSEERFRSSKVVSDTSFRVQELLRIQLAVEKILRDKRNGAGDDLGLDLQHGEHQTVWFFRPYL
jgi:hypothetical protein